MRERRLLLNERAAFVNLLRRSRGYVAIPELPRNAQFSSAMNANLSSVFKGLDSRATCAEKFCDRPGNGSRWRMHGRGGGRTRHHVFVRSRANAATLVVCFRAVP